MKHTQLIGEYRYTRTGVRCPISVFIYFLSVLSNLTPLAFFTHTHSQRGPNHFLSYDGHKLNIPQMAPFTTMLAVLVFFLSLQPKYKRLEKMENEIGHNTIQGTGAAETDVFLHLIFYISHAPALFLSTKSAPL